MKTISLPSTIFFLKSLLVATAKAPVKTSLYIPMNSASDNNATTAMLSASLLGVSNASQTTWIIQQGPKHSFLTLVEGPTDVIVPIAPTAATTEGGFVSCAFGNGSASCVEGATVSSVVTLVSTFTEAAVPTAVLVNDGGNLKTSTTSTKSSRTSTAHPKHTGAAMRHSPAGVLLALLGSTLISLAL